MSSLAYHDGRRISSSPAISASVDRTAQASPLVSVIIPAFNHARFVGRCLDSVLASDYANKEIVVIDDGSSDGTAAVIEKWASSNRDAISISALSRPNRGATRTLNELLLKAHGEFVLPIASDDYLLPGGVQSLVTALREDQGCRAVFGDCIVVDEMDRMVSSSSLFEYRRTNRRRLQHRLADELITNWTVAGPALLYVRESILSIGGYSEGLLVEDWDFYLRLAARGWLRFVDCKVAAYRLHAGNAHLDVKTGQRRMTETRMVALGVARKYHGRQRVLLLLEFMSRCPPLHLIHKGKLTHLPLRVVRKSIRLAAYVFLRRVPVDRCVDRTPVQPE